MGVGIEEFFRLHLAGLYHHDQLSLNAVKGWSLSQKLDIVSTDLVDEDEHLVVVAPELFKGVPIR